MAPQTASELKVMETAKRGMQAIGLVSLAVVSAPVVIIACPLLGAYEFATAYDAELYSGSKFIDGVIGGLFGVVTSPLAPFYIAWGVIEELYKEPPPKPISISNTFQEQAHRDIGLDCLNFYNIAVVGVTGTGKLSSSSVVNGLLGYRDSHPFASKVGEIESTAQPLGYRHPVLPTLMIWDMPGAGTKSHPAKSYYEDKYLQAFDALVIVTGDRLMATDVHIARAAHAHGQPYYIVRNKMDVAIQSRLRRQSVKGSIGHNQWASTVGELANEMQIQRDMKMFNFNTENLFLISAWDLQNLVISLRNHQPVGDMRIIHEKILITTLLDTIAEKRRQELASDSGISTEHGNE
ncbi:hypothetical protein K450DRAFT_301283 [Umbelopsis ramanniana AG]|uniref:IRG-type G domain-containing protein n=1 Tax=Umbelopsis ramanniana AG TaxID=1314678 RepID=A0AAD5HD75_UMBRA|nr:uncharacterized protein K450DRAFT_301283 [Umbelopsis ramanniana AG]KAI8578281.1 hypothetical protein K450DRAFT_301283 [Umbelopsis ramanniana AG]